MLRRKEKEEIRMEESSKEFSLQVDGALLYYELLIALLHVPVVTVLIIVKWQGCRFVRHITSNFGG
jgi:hypothetical protein